MAYIKKLVMKGFKSFPKKTEIPFSPDINIVLGPNGSGKCLTYDSLVQLGDGSIKQIGDIVESTIKNSEMSAKTEDGYIAPANGTEVVSLNLDSYKTENKKIKSFVKRTSPSKLLRITTQSGKTMTATKYHPFFTFKDNKVQPLKAEEIQEGSRIAVPRKFNYTPKTKKFTGLINSISKQDNIYVPYNEDFEIILKQLKKHRGWKELANRIGVSFYSLKGLLDKQAIRFSNLIKILTYADLSEEKIIDYLNEIRMNGKNTNFSFENSQEFSRFFGYLLSEGRLADSSQIWFTNSDKNIINDYVNIVKKLFNKEPLVREYKPGCWDVIIFSEPLNIILSKLGISSKTQKKKISNDFLKHSSDKEISELLNGLYSGNGYVSNSKPSIEITTKSENLKKGIETCLLRLGILYKSKKVSRKFNEINQDYYNVYIYGAENISLFYNHIKLKHKIKSEKIKKYLSLTQNTNIDLIEANNLVKKFVSKNGINVKNSKKHFSRLDSYCYNGCTPSRHGLKLLLNNFSYQESKSFQEINKLVNSDIFWDKIDKVEEIPGEEWVYDLCIDKNHNFIANNVVAHNSNISDAICFVLGRLSVKSMRAEKAKNLIFMGTKSASPAKEAEVELVFDNSHRTFSLEAKEVSIKRIVRKNGQGIYKINGETKTRQEILNLLSQAGIDPNGFNIILQGEIQNFVKMHTEERRRVIEEVSGISVYESRKSKSLKELEKTEEKLKEVNAVLRERTTYLNNLEKERQQALKYKKLQKNEQNYKASIINCDLKEKKREKEKLSKDVEKKNKEIDKVKNVGGEIKKEIQKHEEKIKSINNKIQQSTGLEQDRLNNEIANLRAELEGLKVKIENNQNKISNIQKQKNNLQKQIHDNEQEVAELQKNKKQSYTKSTQEKELQRKNKELEKLEEERKKHYMIKSELKSIKERLQEKTSYLQNYNNESEFLLKQIDKISEGIYDKNTTKEKIDELRESLEKNKNSLEQLNNKEKEIEKTFHTNEYEIDRQNKLIEKISKMNVCPVCKNKITEKHIKEIKEETNPQIQQLQTEIDNTKQELQDIKNQREQINDGIKNLNEEISKRESDLTKISNIEDKKEQIKSLNDKINSTKKEIEELEKRKSSSEKDFNENTDLEERYEKLKMEVQDISTRNKENLDSDISFKQKEIDRARISLKQLQREEMELNEEYTNLTNKKDQKEKTLHQKKNKEQELNKKFQSMISERDSYQKKIREKEQEQSNKQNQVSNLERELNELNVNKARIDAEIENSETEILEYPDAEIINSSKEKLKQKLQKTQDTLSKIGSVNLRALDTYDEIKKEYDSIKQKVEIVQKEKEDIMKVIHEIDVKKKRTFMKTLEKLNEAFAKNFTQLSSKGQVSLELENRKEPFKGGVGIAVKTGHGKYFDVTSLSGGEQTLVALSLIFAIQELNPYVFYVLDEIDAALDKRNSQRLANLLKKYMQRGQYIIVTHNDEVISRATNVYGVSMHDGISKITSLKV